MILGSIGFQDSVSIIYGLHICKPNNANTVIRQFLITAVLPASLQQTYWENSKGEEEDIQEYKVIFLACWCSTTFWFSRLQLACYETTMLQMLDVVMAGELQSDNRHFLRKLHEIPADLLGQHFSLSHAGHRCVGICQCPNRKNKGNQLADTSV